MMKKFHHQQILFNSKLKIKTSPEMNVSFFGFNVRQNGECVSFASAPGTGASLYASGFTVKCEGAEFFAELAVDGADGHDVLKIKLKSGEVEKEYDLLLASGMNTYRVKLSGEIQTVDSLHIMPSAAECLITVKQIGFCTGNAVV